MTFEDFRYDQDFYSAFTTFVDIVHNSNCDSDSDCEYTDEQNTTFLNNFVVEYRNLIKKYLMNHDILDAHKAKIELLDEEMTNFLEKKLISWAWISFFSWEK